MHGLASIPEQRHLAEETEMILAEGLKPMARQYAHLIVDRKTASQAGRRKTAIPVILEIAPELEAPARIRISNITRRK